MISGRVGLPAVAVLAIAVTGCGGASTGSEAGLRPPPLTVPGYTGTPKVSKPKEAPGADAVQRTTTETTSTPAGVATTEDTAAAPEPPATSGAEGASAQDAAAQSDTTSGGASPSGGAKAQFQDFCANNPGAC